MPNLVNRVIAMSFNRLRNTLITWKLQRNGQGPMPLPVGGFARPCAKRTRVQLLLWGKQRSTSWQRINARNFAKELLVRLEIWPSSSVVSQTTGKLPRFFFWTLAYTFSHSRTQLCTGNINVDKHREYFIQNDNNIVQSPNNVSNVHLGGPGPCYGDSGGSLFNWQVSFLSLLIFKRTNDYKH